MREANYPLMLSEVLEAVHLMYEDEPDVEADCYLYLTNLEASDLVAIKFGAVKRLSDMGRCMICGSKLKTDSYKEPHFELGDGVYETLHEVYCPVCDKGEEHE